jgi:hypothetical protein
LYFIFIFTRSTLAHGNKFQTHYHMSACSCVRPREKLVITQSILLSSSKLQDANDVIICTACMHVHWTLIVYNEVYNYIRGGVHTKRGVMCVKSNQEIFRVPSTVKRIWSKKCHRARGPYSRELATLILFLQTHLYSTINIIILCTK